MVDKVSIADVADGFADYLAKNTGWGNLHVVLSDGNTGDSSVSFCKQIATEKGDSNGVALCDILLNMSKTQRKKIPYVARSIVDRRMYERRIEP
jgi:predicted amidohydrolase